MHPRRWQGRPAGAVWAASVMALALPAAHALFGLEGSGGTFRYGHVHYRQLYDNTVEFTIEAAFTRKVETSYFYGSAVDGYAQLGDKITMTGRETPEFDFGDFKVIKDSSVLTMDVTAYSEREDWVMGKVVVVHKYDTPNNDGNPWLARFTGCCRYSRLLNNADNPWELIAQVDLQMAPASPRVSVLPLVSVPQEPDLQSSQRLPKILVPATITASGKSPPKTAAMHWTKETPFEVGNAASFLNGFTSLSLEEHFSKRARICCTNRANPECAAVQNNPSVSPGCLARMLATDFQLRTKDQSSSAQTVSPAMTIEGWVKINKNEGGVVLSTGRAAGKTCHNKGSCAVAMIYIKVNATHVTVGHETALDDRGLQFTLHTVDFAIASSEPLVEQLTDTGFYLDSNGASLVGKFVHIAVVRKSNVGPSHSVGCEPKPGSGGTGCATGPGTDRAADGGLHGREFWFSTYKVYVNGFLLEVAKYPYCAAGAACTNGGRYGGYASPDIVSSSGCYASTESQERMTEDNGCKVELTIGESNPVPGPRRPMANGLGFPGLLPPADGTSGRCFLLTEQGLCMDNFGNETALLFGAYRGAAGLQDSYLDGLLDEWRFWNGERSRADILNSYRRPLVPGMSNDYGDPTIVFEGTTGVGRMTTKSNYQTTSVLIALYSFDWSKSRAKDEELCPSKIVGCMYKTLGPTFPVRPTGYEAERLWQSIWTAVVDDVYKGVKNAQTDASGVMFYKSGTLYHVEDASRGVVAFESKPAPGMYQVTIQVAGGPNLPSVPVDFMVNIMDSIYEDGQIAYKLNDKVTFPFNDYIPTISFEAPVKAHGSDGSGVLFVGSGQLPDAGDNWKLFDGFSYPKKARAYAGFGLEVKILGMDEQGVYSAALAQTPDWRDTKVGFSIGPTPDSARFSTVKDTNPSEIMMHWTPCVSEIGDTIMCFDAVDYHILRGSTPSQDKVANPASSNMRCLNFDVRPDPAPQFKPGIPRTLSLFIGREGTLDLIAWDDNCLDTVTIHLAPGSEMPPGAVLDTATKEAQYCTGVKRIMRWTPGTKMGGFTSTTCFTVQDTGGSATCGEAAPHSATHCVTLQVHRCKYALQRDQQLQEISSLFGVDWMRLWSLNMAIAHPDYVVYDGQVVSVGHLYRVAPNERLDRIAQRLGMSMELMLDLNFDLVNATVDTLAIGRELCVVPNSCQGHRDTFYSGMVYKDDKFYAPAKTSDR